MSKESLLTFCTDQELWAELSGRYEHALLVAQDDRLAEENECAIQLLWKGSLASALGLSRYADHRLGKRVRSG